MENTENKGIDPTSSSLNSGGAGAESEGASKAVSPDKRSPRPTAAKQAFEELKASLISIRFVRYEKGTGFAIQIVITTKDLREKVVEEWLKKGYWQIKQRPDLICPKCQKSDKVEEWGPIMTTDGPMFLVKCTRCNHPWDAWHLTDKKRQDSGVKQ